MRTHFLRLAVIALAWPVAAAERAIDFSRFPPDQSPPGFRSAVFGEGKAGDWKVILDQVPSAMQPLTPDAPAVSKRAVLAQLSHDPTDEHFPLLILDLETFDDFSFSTRFKTVSGAMEQIAGIAFRIQDEKNFYVVRASSLGNNFRFYKVVNGERGKIIGPSVEIPKGVWHELTIECKGNQIRSWLNGKELIPMLTDNSFTSGKIGFLTKSDSVSYFAESRVTYTPREVFAQVVVREMMKEYPRLLGLKVFAPAGSPPALRLIASNIEKEIGQTGDEVEEDCVKRGQSYYSKAKNSVTVTLPLRDRNGDSIAAVRVTMKTFAGQTEQNALARALPVIKEMQVRIQSDKDLMQ